MLYATNRFPGDGVTTQYEISFTGGYLDRAHVKAYVEGADLVRTPITLTAGNFIGPYTIVGLAPAPVGSTVVIYRDTPKAPIVDFVNGSRFTESNLDTATRQGSFIAAEGADASLGNVSEYADRAEAAAQIATGASTAAVTAKDTVVALLSGAAGSNDNASALSAAASAAQAANSATAAGTSASTATTQAGIATAKAEEAALYAALAGQSAGGGGGGLASPAGASLVGFQQAGMGAVSTTVQSKLRESLSVKDFGAVGNGVTNDTAAIQAALDYAAANSLSLRFPAGTYIATGLTFTATAPGHVCIVGDGSGNTLLQAPPGSTAPVFKLGVGGSSLGPNQMLFQGLSFKGNYPGSYQASAAAYTQHTFLVDTSNHILFDDCRFYNGVNGLTVRNGVITHLHRCGAWYNEIGFYVATPGIASAGTTTFLDKTDAKNNHRWGVYFDDGRMLTMSLCTVEGNGGNGPSSTGGVYVGEYTGGENGPGFNAIGAVIDTTWFEANAGAAQVYLRSGSNTMRDCNFTNVPTSSVIMVDGGRYFLDRLRFENNKTYHIYEFAAANVLAGNSITNCFVGATTNTPANVLYDPAKTSINFGGSGGGAAVTVRGNNVGTGSGLLYRGAVDGTGTRTLEFKTLFASTGITVTNSGETVNVAVAPATVGVIGGVRPGAGLLVDGAGVLTSAAAVGGWANAVLEAGWTTFTTHTVRYRREGDVVRLSGAMQYKSSTVTDVPAFTLPAGFRPVLAGYAALTAAGGGNTRAGLIVSDSTGVVTVTATNAVVFLDGITFPTT